MIAGFQTAVHKPGQASYLHWETGYGTPDWCLPERWPVPHEEPIEKEELFVGRAGMEWLWGWGPDVYTATADVDYDRMEVMTRLYDDGDLLEDPLPPWYHGCKARVYGLRRGGYFFVSYGGRQLDDGILSNGEYAMDLTKTSVIYDWYLFPTGALRFTNIATSTHALGIEGALSLASGIVSLTLVPASMPASTAFAVMSVVFGIVDQVDYDTGALDGRTEGCMYHVHLRYGPGQEMPALDDKWSYPHFGHVTDCPWIEKDIKVEERLAYVGDQLVQFIELESDCSAKSYASDSHDVSQKTEFKCSSSEDFNTMRVRAWDN